MSIYPEQNKKKNTLMFQELEKNGLCYDLKFALRLCSEHGHKRECVHIYSLMGLYEEAVDLALQVNILLSYIKISSK